MGIGGVPVNATVDAFGNLVTNPETGTGAGVVTATYDAANRLVALDGPGTTHDAAYTFDALGRHATRDADPGSAGGVDTFTYLGTSETVAGVTGSAGLVRLLDPAGASLAVRDTGSGAVNWVLPDLHGNIAGGLAGTTVASAIRYDGYGVVLATGSAGGTSVAPERWRYQGRMDLAPGGSATPRYDAGARDYSPGLGTFTSLDPVRGSALDPASLNRYLYAHGNPATLIDPDGHAALPACNTDKYDFCHPASIPRGTEANGNTGGTRRNPPPPGTNTGGGAVAPDRGRKRATLVVNQGRCSVYRLDCSVADFDRMSAQGRLNWLEGLDRFWGARGNFGGWYSAIGDILRFAGDRGLFTTGNWMSVVDAHILNGIENGLAAHQGRRHDGLPGSGFAEWQAFFVGRARGRSDVESIRLWGIAEQTATDWGNGRALEAGLRPASPGELITGLGAGNIFRAALQNRDAAVRAATGAGRAFAGVSGAVVGNVGSTLFLDPRKSGPIYVTAHGIYGATHDNFMFGLLRGPFSVLMEISRHLP